MRILEDFKRLEVHVPERHDLYRLFPEEDLEEAKRAIEVLVKARMKTLGLK